MGQTTHRLQVIVINGQFLAPNGKSIHEYDYLELGHKYRLLPETEIQLSSLDGKNIYDAVGPGLLLLDSKGSVLLNGKALKPKDQQSLLHNVTATKMPSYDLAGLPFRGIKVVPDQEKRSFIQEVDGYDYIGENMVLAQARKTAFANAGRRALEMARAHIESNKLVKDGILEYDLIPEAEGIVSVLEQKDHGLVDNRYHVWIRAEVEYVLKQTGQKPRPSKIMSPAAPLTVQVWTPRKLYKQGEIVKVFIQGNRDFYARIVNIDSEGNITQLLPNDHRNINLFKGSHVYKIPDAEDHFTIKVRAPYGEDQVVVYASDVPLGQVETESIGQGLRQYSGTRYRLGVQTRSLFIAPQPVGSHVGAEFYEATWKLKTIGR
ncbi:MAG: DUF4384 domain-containing protein [Deltaproteobacteria bacterium]|nr:DUF4384 domain-containing protein [Deltaproteobacteria bacterium]